MTKKQLKTVVQLPSNLLIGFHKYDTLLIVVSTHFVNISSVQQNLTSMGFKSEEVVSNFIFLDLAEPVSQSLSSFMTAFGHFVKDEVVLADYTNMIQDLNNRNTGILNTILSGKIFAAGLKSNLNF